MASTKNDVPDTATARPYLIELDPADVLSHPSNVRKDLGDLTELAASITGSTVGIVQYPVLVPVTNGYQIIAGHRRMAAAMKAGVTSQTCVVRPDMAGLEPEQIAAMIMENIHRAGLHAGELSGGFAQLALFDWTPEEIATRTGVGITHVRQQLALDRLPEKAAELADRGDLTLEDAAALTELDEKTVNRILNKDNGWAVRHAIEAVNAKNKALTQLEADRKRFEEAGLPRIEKPRGWPWDCRETRVRHLQDPAGRYLKPEDVLGRPGFAWFIDPNNGRPEAVVVCVDPVASGYRRDYGSYVSPEEKAAKQRREAELAAFGEELARAAEVRRQFLMATYGGARATKTLFRPALLTAARNPGEVEISRDSQELLTTFVGAALDSLDDTTSVERLQRVMVGRWLLHQEEKTRSILRAWDRQHNVAAVLSYLDRLVSDGYALSDAETRLVGELKEETRPGRTSVDQLDAPCRDCGATVGEECDSYCDKRNLDEDDDEEGEEDGSDLLEEGTEAEMITADGSVPRSITVLDAATDSDEDTDLIEGETDD